MNDMSTNTEKTAALPGQVQPMVGLMCTACGENLLEAQDWPWNFRAFGRICNHCRDVAAGLVYKHGRYRKANAKLSGGTPSAGAAGWQAE
jgi:hypothetical protein